MASIKLASFEEELKKNPELKESDIQILRKWSNKQTHLPKMSDSELVLFLHSNYYQLEPTKTTIDTFFTVRTHVPEFFCNRDLINDKEVKKATKTVTTQILEGITREGHKIIYGRLIDSEPSHFVFTDAIKLLFMTIDLWLYMEGTCNGHVLIIDMKNISLGHVARLSPMTLKKFFYYLQEGLPVRLKGFHLINVTPVVDIIFNMIKPFMKKQLMDMFHMHTTNDTLEKFVSLEVLPNEVGGQAGLMQKLHDKQMKKLADHVAWFQKDEANHRVNESLRLDKAKIATDLFGVEGSFKKLEID
ncbi:PREDICTED: alpha-tocopherol transfer protein-like [Trachymyrmex cornetzi]|uniref:Alpha-tocopherol transfer protein-like protein n=1 Tax=Trachymyrmex cornetzi TaxID=471704 RepID=A0A195DLY0_9HYME|nr:PREDICTED: alpha-tocopherol transfer protein-like [Trachymyrmex cornetzi]XP_018371125.1 PREDICTED: alpha-tocopherol transfer protein-like [Trachymyrmex cornetzi]XP_018371126.1 PREDICTED: alpha-tocopherol transfer protein-like [Trachymyrmex cornetzi]KYN13837.1 Alpha-tocopherol transfer protein-like protein [Trachymyrmex cornetzi]